MLSATHFWNFTNNQLLLRAPTCTALKEPYHIVYSTPQDVRHNLDKLLRLNFDEALQTGKKMQIFTVHFTRLLNVTNANAGNSSPLVLGASGVKKGYMGKASLPAAWSLPL